MLKLNNCLRCDHKWLPRTEFSLACPHCKSYRWAIPRKNRKNKEDAEKKSESVIHAPSLSINSLEPNYEKNNHYGNQTMKGGTNGMAEEIIKLTKPVPILTVDEEAKQRAGGEFKLTKPKEV